MGCAASSAAWRPQARASLARSLTPADAKLPPPRSEERAVLASSALTLAGEAASREGKKSFSSGSPTTKAASSPRGFEERQDLGGGPTKKERLSFRGDSLDRATATFTASASAAAATAASCVVAATAGGGGVSPSQSQHRTAKTQDAPAAHSGRLSLWRRLLRTGLRLASTGRSSCADTAAEKGLAQKGERRDRPAALWVSSPKQRLSSAEAQKSGGTVRSRRRPPQPQRLAFGGGGPHLTAALGSSKNAALLQARHRRRGGGKGRAAGTLRGGSGASPSATTPRHALTAPEDNAGGSDASQSDVGSVCSGSDLKPRPPIAFLQSLGQPALFCSRVRTHERLTDLYALTETVLGTVKSLKLPASSPRRLRLLYNEVAVYLQLDHPNIVKLLDVFVDGGCVLEERRRSAGTLSLRSADELLPSASCNPTPSAGAGKNGAASKAPFPTEGTFIRLVMEYCGGRELYERLSKKKRYGEREAAVITRQMLSAINYCHQHRICHRDLKLENWVYRDSSEDAPLKLIDFGFSRLLKPDKALSAIQGTVYYIAPEVMDGHYNQLCDIWSIGVIVYMLLSGVPPFDGTADYEILIKIRRAQVQFQGPRWEGVSEMAKHFIRSLLKRRPEERLTAAAALNHPWLSDAEGASRVAPLPSAPLRSLRSFAKCSPLQRASLALVAIALPSADAADLERIFNALDRRGGGTLLAEDFVRVLKEELQISTEEALQIFESVDQTGDGEINYSEFLAATLLTRVPLTMRMVREAFDRFDLDGSGVISAADLQSVMGERLLRQCKLERDAFSFEEFVEALFGEGVPPSLLRELSEEDRREVLAVLKRKRGLASTSETEATLLALETKPLQTAPAEKSPEAPACSS